MQTDLDSLITAATPNDPATIDRVAERLFGPPGVRPSKRSRRIERVWTRLFGTPPRLLPPRYEPRGIVGRGAFGTVYRAYDTELGRIVAIKVVRYDTTEQEARLGREAEALAQLDHPNVVPVYDRGVLKPGSFYLSLQLIPGSQLDAWLDAAPRSTRDILGVFLQVARGLEAVHAKGLIHRDFKPANVIVGDDGRVRLVDFGLAKRVDHPSDDEHEVVTIADTAITAADSMTTSTDRCDGGGTATGPVTAAAIAATSCPAWRIPAGELSGRGDRQRCARLHLDDSVTEANAFLGTTAYAPPEQLEGSRIDARSDIFSFCVALFEAVHGFRPFAGTTRSTIARHIERGQLREDVPQASVPRWLRRLLLRGLSPLPEQRPPDFASIISILESKLRPPGRRFATIAVMAGVTAALATSVWASWPQPPMLDAEWRSTSEARAGLDQTFGEAIEDQLDAYEQRWRAVAATVSPDDAPPEVVGCLRFQMETFDRFVTRLAEAPASAPSPYHPSMIRPHLWMTELSSPEDCLTRPEAIVVPSRSEALDRLLESQLLQLSGSFPQARDEATEARALVPASDPTALSGAIDFQRAYLALQLLDPLANEAIESAKLAQGVEPEFLVDVLTLQLIIETHLGDRDANSSSSLPDRILELLSGLEGPHHASWGWVHLALGQRALGSDPRGALGHLREASRHFDTAGGRDSPVMVAFSDLHAAYALSALAGRETEAADLAVSSLERLLEHLGPRHPTVQRWILDVVHVLGVASRSHPGYGALIRPLLEGARDHQGGHRDAFLEVTQAEAELLLLDAWAASSRPVLDEEAKASLLDRALRLQRALGTLPADRRRRALARIAEAIATARVVADEGGSQTVEAMEQWVVLADDPRDETAALDLFRQLTVAAAAEQQEASPL